MALIDAFSDFCLFWRQILEKSFFIIFLGLIDQVLRLLVQFHSLKEAVLIVLLQGLLLQSLKLRRHFLVKVTFVLVEGPIAILLLLLLCLSVLDARKRILELLPCKIFVDDLRCDCLDIVVDFVTRLLEVVLCDFDLLLCLLLLLRNQLYISGHLLRFLLQPCTFRLHLGQFPLQIDQGVIFLLRCCLVIRRSIRSLCISLSLRDYGF